ncbi:P-loop containing nucleoside triphosphate hydrolase protein [Lophiotrema nucula]|uniref:P-loop containing nucleoside triphosphate hydrolase protein n=1 Tax=Lophiotrema nucula TaxID=690887 RepID=A0A6A5YSL7_9PLEO|nr:P-loop containing nucleoside triphosphate hydrolase protein [Lophiotrema nucula]
MGMTGAGKSTFISHCTQRPVPIAGHGLSSCTSRVTIHTMRCSGRTVHLIDTPGFDDTGRSDGETLQELAYWLSEAYARDIQVSGIVYLHRITDTRLQGSALRALNAFKSMCGEGVYCGIVIATTRWDEVAPEQLDATFERQQELCKKHWTDIIENDGLVVELSSPRYHALEIIKRIVRKDRRFVFNFQRQLIEEAQPLHLTDAGKILFEPQFGDYTRLQNQLAEAQNRFDEALASKYAKDQQDAKQAIEQVTKSLTPLEADIQRMQHRTEEIQKQWEDKLRKDKESLRQAYKIKKEQLELKKDELAQAQSNLTTPVRRERKIQEEVDELEREKGEIYIRSRQKLSSRSTETGRKVKIMSVVGTSLAVGQLVAAMACTVM